MPDAGLVVESFWLFHIIALWLEHSLKKVVNYIQKLRDFIPLAASREEMSGKIPTHKANFSEGLTLFLQQSH